MTSTQPAIPVLDGKRLPTSVVGALARDRLEDELVGLLVEQEDRGRLRVEDRPRDLDDRAAGARDAPPLAEHARRDGGCAARRSLIATPSRSSAVR